MVSRAAQRVGGGAVKALVSRHVGGAVVLTTLRDGYYLVVSLGPGRCRGGRAPLRGSAPASSTRRSSGARRPAARRARPHARGAGDAARGSGARASPARRRSARGGRAGAGRAPISASPRWARRSRSCAPRAARSRSGGLPAMRALLRTSCVRSLERPGPGPVHLLEAALGRVRGGRERCRQDHQHRQARGEVDGRGPLGAAVRGRHVPCGGCRAAGGLVRAGRRRLSPRRRRRRSLGGVDRRPAHGEGARQGRGAGGHRRAAAHQDQPDGRARQDGARGRARGRRARRTRRCWCWTPRSGSNGLAQGREFAKAAGVSGLVLTKLDGTAKGGVAVAVVRELERPDPLRRGGRAGGRPAAVRCRRVRGWPAWAPTWRPPARAGATDERLMRRALELAARGIGETNPNPLVGCVVARGGRIVGEGFHHLAGGPHAEVLALRAAGARARGATLYVTLEPCSHHGRTPPCAPLVREAGIARVVAALARPRPARGRARAAAAPARRRPGHDRRLRDRSRGPERPLPDGRAARPPVRPAEGRADARRPHRHSLGRIEVDHEPRGSAARRAALRRLHDAVVVGIGTVAADDPLLLPQPRTRRPFTRVVLDTHLRLPLASRLVASAGARTPVLVLCGEPSPARSARARGARRHCRRDGRPGRSPRARRLARGAPRPRRARA